jgi:hypothetical protein
MNHRRFFTEPGSKYGFVLETSLPPESWRRYAAATKRQPTEAAESLDDDLPNVYDDPEEEL